MTNDPAFSDEQRHYLEGLLSGANAARALRGLPTLSRAMAGLAGAAQTPVALTASAVSGPDAMARQAQDKVIAGGGKLCKEEKAKREKNALDLWDEMADRAAAGAFPKGTDVFLMKYHGLFHVAPAQNAYMCRLRLPGGVVSAHQFRGIADLAEKYGGGYAHVTTRANLQIREIGPGDPLHVYDGLVDLGVIIRGSGADNIRNVTASPTAGIDRGELIDTLPLAKAMHHYILNHREMYGLPRKFNIAFDGGGAVSPLADTNDIGFTAVRIDASDASAALPAGVYMRLELGGITGHKDFARDTGVILRPDQCVKVAAAVVRVFVRTGDRTDRNKARLKYVLDAWGFDKFMAEVEKEYGSQLPRLELEKCESRGPVDPMGHIGVHPQKQDGLNYIGVVVPVGRLTCRQMHGLAHIADEFGSGVIRLTVWQNLLISDVPDAHVAAVKGRLKALGLDDAATNVRAGLVACTGNTGCKFAASDTKTHAGVIADYLDATLQLDHPINIHLTGCHHSCAQHYIGDIGLLASKVARGEEMIEAYHIHIGGGYGREQHIGREIYRDVCADEAPAVIERMLVGYQQHRSDERETFSMFTRRHELDELRRLFDAADQLAAS
ncbi:MAG: NirA family protein [Planctomycetes bacterium]|nr:NirA family protein [Planctomycetota bacterium]